jgi:hypothetical protein
MIIIITLQLAIMVSLIWASRHSLENALPVFAFFVVLMPLESRLVIPGLCDFNTMRLSLMTLLVLYLVKREPSTQDTIPLKWLMLLNIAWAICSTVFSLSMVTSVKQLISQGLEYYLLFFLFVRIMTKLQTLYNVLYGVIMAMGLCCVFSLIEAYGHWSILRIFPANLWITYNGGLDPLYIEWGRGLRVRSTFPHPILFGDALAITIPIALYLLSIWQKGRQRLLLSVSLLLMVWAIYKTSSRGPWIALAMCCCLLFIMTNGRVRKYLLITAVLGVIVVVSRPGIWQTIADLYVASTDATSPVGASYLYRDTLSQTIEQVVHKDATRFVFGYGLGTFRELGLEITFLNVTQRWYTCDDNWALFIYELGYGGLLITTCLLFAPIWIAIRNLRLLPRPENRLSGVLLISLLGFYFLLLSVAGYSWGQQGYLNWILISLVVCHSRLAYQVEEQENLLEVEARELDTYDFDFA